MTGNEPTPDRTLQLISGYRATGIPGFEDVTVQPTPSPATLVQAR